MDKDELSSILNFSIRNKFEQKENELIKEVYKYLFKDVNAIKALCNVVFHYRKEIAEIKAVELLIASDMETDIK